MPSAASNVPDENALLCEGCGYILQGLPENSRCPECSRPISQSLPHIRRPPAWERSSPNSFSRWLVTTTRLIFHPTPFYRLLPTRTDSSRSRGYARINLFLVSLLFGITGYFQFDWLELWRWIDRSVLLPDSLRIGGSIALFAALAGITLALVNRLAARLTAWEAAYRGLRLPRAVVLRGLHYHTAHYFPVALLALATVGGWRLALEMRWISELWALKYTYLLGAEVIASAIYLFITYWIGMKNMMFANG